MQIWMSNEQEKVTLTEAQEEIVRTVIAKTVETAGSELRQDGHVEVSVTFVDDGGIRELNREHRGLDQPTDVLSFSQLEGEEMAGLPPGEPLLLGDLVISLERCLEQAREYGHSFERELGFLVAHGTLHLLGMDHATPEAEEAMMARTEEILGGLGLRR